MSHHTPGIGGPGTMLPRAIESLLSWSFAIACLSVSGYHYIVGTLIGPYRRQIQSLILNESRQESATTSCSTATGSSSSSSSSDTATSTMLTLPCWVPLMSYSRGEVDRATPFERYQQFVQVLQTSGGGNGNGKGEAAVGVGSSSINSSSKESPKFKDNELVALIRTNESLRRLASLTMRPSDRHTATSTRTSADSSTSPGCDTSQDSQCAVQQTPLGQQLIRIWPRLLELPESGRQQDYPFAVSLIVPCYREQGSHVRVKLQHALNSSVHPEQIQLVLVDAGKCTDLAAAVSVSNGSDENDDTANNDNHNKSMNRSWGQVKVIEYTSQGGRGPCLNFGAEHAVGRVYAFLHSDTRLPAEWDTKLASIFDAGGSKSDDQNSAVTAAVSTSVRANSCAFGFGIDTTREGLHGGSLPPGIRAVEVTANLRCQLWSLPYGDQCLCVPATIFDSLGGYPHQCFMEDYEFIALLRKRAALLPTLGAEEEALVIVPGAPALCSPRRWQTFGVLHVTYTNSKLVNLYASGGRTPEQIYELYYGQTPPSAAQLGPWETRLVVE
jgi:hypothetical protein